MIILDTNVLSELIRPKPDRVVVGWVSSRPSSSLFTTTVTEAEILYSLYLMPPGKRHRDLEEAIRDMFTIDLAGRVLPFDEASAYAYADIAVSRRQAGQPITQFDAQIAAIARSRDASVATRNVSDFEGCGIDVINPWQG